MSSNTSKAQLLPCGAVDEFQYSVRGGAVAQRYEYEGRNYAVPFLCERAVSRTGERELPGFYCDMSDVWVVQGVHGIKPLASTPSQAQELVTKTKARMERDDDGAAALLGAITKTAVQLESDDDRFVTAKPYALLQLYTKTEAKIERDDT